MIVTLIPPSTIRLSFAFDLAVNERLKSIGGQWHAKCWILPVSKLDALIREFGDDLAIDPDVFMAAPERTPVMNFKALLSAAGITLTDIDGRLIGSGGAYCESPWQALIDERADALRALQPVPLVTKSVSLPKVTLDDARLTDFDKIAARSWSHWVEDAAKKEAMIERRKTQWTR